MKPIAFALRAPPPQRLDLTPLTPEKLAGKSRADIERIEIQTTRERLTVGDAFKVTGADPRELRFLGGSERLDRIGCGMAQGSILVEGAVGVEAGRLMSGGSLMILGDAGPFAASKMKGGLLVIDGTVGERLGGPLAGETEGMSGGFVHVTKNAGERAGDRLRRGTIAIEGHAGDWAGSRMIAGTLLIGRKAGALPGYLMGRGTIVLAHGADELAPTFGDCGRHELVAARLLGAHVRPFSARLAAALTQPLRRLAGDLAALGKGEILLAER